MKEVKVHVIVGVHPKTKQHVVRIVKATFDATSNKLLERRVLSQTGKWLELLSGSIFPDNTAFNVTVREFFIED